MNYSKYTTLFIFLSITLNIFSQVNQQWVNTYTTPGNNSDRVFAITVDVSGNVIVAGSCFETASRNDCYTVKYSPEGQLLWVQRYNGPVNMDDIGTDIITDNAGNIYVTGYSQGAGTEMDCFIVKYDSSGVQKWSQRYDAAGKRDQAFSICIDNMANIFITGESVFAGINEDLVTIKYDSSGNQIWMQSYNGPGNSYDVGRKIKTDDSGNVYVAAYSVGMGTSEDFATIKYDNSGAVKWINRYDNGGKTDRTSSLIVNGSGSLYVIGTSNSTINNMDGLIIKYGINGNEEWVKLFNGPDNLNDHLNAIDLDNSGNLYITGSSNTYSSRYNFATMKYDPNGTQLWVNYYNGPSNNEDASYDIKVDNSGNCYVTGTSMDTIAYWAGIRSLTMKYDNSGNRVWVQRYTPAQGVSGTNDLTLDDFGNIYVAGHCSGASSNDDYLTIKYSQYLIGIQPVINQFPGEFLLSQNYPNPFNPSTKINFSIPYGETTRRVVVLKIYDILGNEITTLINRQLTPGTYSVDWDASNFPGGIYFYRLSSGEYTESKKMILLK